MLICWVFGEGIVLGHSVAFADRAGDAEYIFDWAEPKYLQHFPTSGQTINTQTTEYNGHNWYYRYYPQSNNYVGINELNLVYVFGDVFNGLLYVDTSEKIIDNIKKEISTVNIGKEEVKEATVIQLKDLFDKNQVHERDRALELSTIRKTTVDGIESEPQWDGCELDGLLEIIYTNDYKTETQKHSNCWHQSGENLEFRHGTTVRHTFVDETVGDNKTQEYESTFIDYIVASMYKDGDSYYMYASKRHGKEQVKYKEDATSWEHQYFGTDFDEEILFVKFNKESIYQEMLKDPLTFFDDFILKGEKVDSDEISVIALEKINWTERKVISFYNKLTDESKESVTGKGSKLIDHAMLPFGFEELNPFNTLSSDQYPNSGEVTVILSHTNNIFTAIDNTLAQFKYDLDGDGIHEIEEVLTWQELRKYLQQGI